MILRVCLRRSAEAQMQRRVARWALPAVLLGLPPPLQQDSRQRVFLAQCL